MISPDLVSLHADIEHRVNWIRADHPDWPCAKGCDTCCRRLAAVPMLTPAEWTLLRAGLVALPAAQRASIRREVAALAESAPRPVTCPLLDRATGACPVYLHRPVACRTYGFYADREAGLYCGDIAAQADAGQLAEVVWGNHEVVERRLAELGAARPLTDWFADWSDND